MMHCRSAFEPGVSGLPHYCTPPVCVPAVIGALAVWQKKNRWREGTKVIPYPLELDNAAQTQAGQHCDVGLTFLRLMDDIRPLPLAPSPQIPCDVVLSFFLGFRRPNLITGLSGWRRPD